MRGICMCVTGPPAGGVCNACGAVGPPLAGPNYPYAPWPPTPPPEPGRYYPPNPLTPEEVRKIVREEIEKGRASGASVQHTKEVT